VSPFRGGGLVAKKELPQGHQGTKQVTGIIFLVMLKIKNGGCL